VTPITLKRVTDCLGATVRNDEFQPSSDPPLVLSLRAQDGQIYVLPLSDRGAARLLEVLSHWRQGRRIGTGSAGSSRKS
jgi:hypothetical protein